MRAGIRDSAQLLFNKVRQVFADDCERVKVGESAKGNRMATRR
jgi:hypothetical protein